jgi:molecular chaperone GrpE (heat shock protein)
LSWSATEEQSVAAVNEEEAGTEVTAVPTESANDPQPLSHLAERLVLIENHLAEFHRRAAHREAIIDRLHEENQRLRDGVGRLVLGPVTADLIRLYGQLDQEGRRLDAAGLDGALVRSFADDVEQILDRCGVEVFSAEPGDPFEGGRHRVAGVVACEHESEHNTVAEVLAPGFYERDTGRVMRPVRARFSQFAPAGAKPDSLTRRNDSEAQPQ